MAGTTGAVGTARPAPRRATVHPRLRARRVAVRRSEGRRRLRMLLWAAGAVALVAGAVGLTRTPLLDVDQVAVSGAVQTGTDQILEVLGIELGDQMTDLDLGAAERRLEELPWVASATVSRDWPNAVRVQVVERRAAASVPVGGTWVLVDASGQVLAETEAPAGAGPVPAILVEGAAPRGVEPGGTVSGIDAPLRVASALTPDLAAWVLAIVPTDEGVDLALVGGATAHLGDEADYDDELRALATVLVRVELDCLSTIDVRAHTNPVVTRRPC